MALTKNRIDLRIEEYTQNILSHNPKSLAPWTTVDLGNTNPHLALFNRGKIKKIKKLKKPFCLEDIPTRNWVASSVIHISLPQKNRLDHLRKADTFIDMKVNYSSSLGQDRLFQSYYLHKLFPKEKIILIDIGTFLTIDFIEREGFKGGYIFPGLQTFMKSYSQGQQLPQYKEISQKIDLSHGAIPHTTDEAISEATKIYIQSSLKEISLKFSDYSPVITGGQGNLGVEILNTNTLYPSLIHLSLYSIVNRLEEGNLP